MPATFIWLIKGRYQLAVTASYCFPAFFTEEPLLKKNSLALFQLIVEANREPQNPISFSTLKDN